MQTKYEISSYEENGVVVLDYIHVEQQHRNKGIGTIAMMSFLSKNKGKKIELHAYPQDETTDVFKLVEFYEKFGFDVVCGSEDSGFEMKNY
jgi:GNAT superfamily N-acetyltransferase